MFSHLYSMSGCQKLSLLNFSPLYIEVTKEVAFETDISAINLIVSCVYLIVQ